MHNNSRPQPTGRLHQLSAPALSEEEQRAQAEALFRSIGDGAIATDQYGRVTRVNPVALKMLGYEEAELLGKWFPKAIVALNAEGKEMNIIDRPIARAFLTGATIIEKAHYRTKQGEVVPVSISVSPIIYQDKPLGAIEVFRDISVEEEVDRMKSEFISLASHQLRTPLAAIKTYSHMLLDGYMGEATPAQKKSLRTILGAANRMNELISTLLNITRIESGSIAISLKKLRVDRVAEEIIKELSLTAAEKEINLTLSTIGKGSVEVRTDNLLLKEIFTNLISNAIKYTPEQGKVAVAVRGRSQDVLVSIADTGWGIPESAQEQVFSKFFRATNIVKRETTGTGLGLYLVKGLLDRLGGNVWFESAEGKGTTFYFTLPKTRRQVGPGLSPDSGPH